MLYYRCLDCGGKFRTYSEAHFCPYCGEMHLELDDSWKTGEYTCVVGKIKLGP